MARVYTLINASPKDREKSVQRLTPMLAALLEPDEGLFSLREPEPVQLELSRLATQFKGVDAILLRALVVLSDFGRDDFSASEVKKIWLKLCALVKSLPHSDRPIEAMHCDARQVPIGPATIDLVITSPPYINVYNYHQQYRGSTEALGWDLLDVARSEIGSNRKHRGNRFLTVIQYCLDIGGVLAELSRVCNRNARFIFVVGRESMVRGIRFRNSDIVASIANDCSCLRLIGRQERVFTNRFGQSIYEDLIHIETVTNERALETEGNARRIARRALEEGLAHASDDIAKDMEAALANVEAIQPSPMLEQKFLEAA